MTPLELLILALIVLTATGVCLTRDPLAQAITVSFYGILLGIMFIVYQAPDVALSQIVVGAVALPLMVLLALARIARDKEESGHARHDGKT